MMLPTAFHIMVKPRGAICNLDCQYCYFLKKEALYPGSPFRMSDDVLESYIRQHIAATPGPEVQFAWQGGEPTLMGLDFFRRVVDTQHRYARPGQRVVNALQTNGVTLDDEWCGFFRACDFLVGLSLDGPRALHDAYRIDKGGGPTFDRVMGGLRVLQEHGVEFNILCAVHAANQDHPLAVYRFLRDEVGASFIQFIPIVERDNASGYQEGNTVTERSVTAEGYGQFLIAVFEEWARRDVGRVYVQMFDVALGQWAEGRSSLCVFAPTCGQALALEHNGDLFSCDHFVEPDYRLGNIEEDKLIPLLASEQQQAFGQAKQDALPAYCRACDVRFACNGGCPKNRFIDTPGGEPGLNYLCAGYQAFFTHIDPAMRFMVGELHHRRPPANIMRWLRDQDAAFQARLDAASRNDPCPCGSGRKLKHCHGRGAG